MTRPSKATTKREPPEEGAEQADRNANDISFISIKTIWTPKSEADYQILAKLGAPMTWISEDSKPLVLNLLSRRGITHQVSSFRELESGILAKVSERWCAHDGYEFSEQGACLLFSGPTPDRTGDRFNSMILKLRNWYGRFHMNLDVQTRVRRKSGTATVTYRVSRSIAPHIVF
jgi:hypothetical protein